MALTNPTAQKSGNVTWLLEFSKAEGGARAWIQLPLELSIRSAENAGVQGLHYSAGARSQRNMAVSPDANTSVSSLVNL
jgi:hypothetical protein